MSISYTLGPIKELNQFKRLSAFWCNLLIHGQGHIPIQVQSVWIDRELCTFLKIECQLANVVAKKKEATPSIEIENR